MQYFLRAMIRVFQKWLWLCTAVYIVPMSLMTFICKLSGTAESIKDPATTYSCLILFVYGFSRIWRFHPVFNSEYLTQLALSPWHAGKELPRGPVHLFWADAVVVAFFMLLSFLYPVHSQWALPLAFLIGYTLGLFVSFCVTKQVTFIALFILLAPLAYYPRLGYVNAVVVCAILTASGTYGLHLFLKNFPWNTRWWNNKQVENLKTQAVFRRIIQWPFRQMRVDPVVSVGTLQSFAIACAAFWWLYTLTSLMPEEERREFTKSLYPVFVIYTIIIRTLNYRCRFGPPISLLGRLYTGHLIIPSYDKIYIAPITLVVVGIFSPILMHKFGVPLDLLFQLSFTLSLFLAMALPPTLKDCYYTGKCRIISVIRKPVRTLKTTPVNLFAQELFS